MPNQDFDPARPGAATQPDETRTAIDEVFTDLEGEFTDFATSILRAEDHFSKPIPSPSEIEASRDQVITAATARMVNEPLGLLAQGLNPSRFDSWMPGLRRKAYRYFPSTTDLIHEVLADAVNPEQSGATDQLLQAMTEAADSLAAPLDVVAKLSEAYVDRLLSDRCFRLEMTAWLVMPDSPTLRDDLRNLHETLVDRGAEGLEAVLVAYGLQMRSPLTWHDLATMVMATVQGTVIRAEVRGEDYDPSILANAIMGVVMGLTYRPDADEGPDVFVDDAYLDHVSG